MQIQIDQSRKIENTNKDTVLAFTNDNEYAILIPGKVKRQLQELFRQKGRPRLFIYRTFAAGITLLLKKDISKFNKIIIDQEYPGKERMIRAMIYEMLARFSDRMPEIVFEKIGKGAKAHGVAYHVGSKERKADMIVKFSEIKKLIFP